VSRSAFHPRQRSSPLLRGALFVALGALLHVWALLVLDVALQYLPRPERKAPPPASLIVLVPPKEEVKEDDPEEDEPEDPEGQIVEIAPPEVEERPEDADYLAEYEQTVEKETRSERYEVNPEVLAKEWSKEAKMEMEDLVDVNVDKPSTGATTGNDRFDPDRHGTLASIPSKWTMTNREGPQDPVPSSHLSSMLSGAPQNDLLDEERGDAVNLNTKEYLYASYLNRIRRLVNFYWEQNLDNLPRNAASMLAKPQYTTSVHIVLDANGAIDHLEVVDRSGSPELDDALVRAYNIAGPFPNPPEGLLERDGRAYLPEMRWTVTVGQAQLHYQGIDPRAGVQFPGLLKSPR
jgi:TonB family protein